MKSSTFLAVSGAVVALASPIMRQEERAVVVTDVVVQRVTVVDTDVVTKTVYGPGSHSLPAVSTTSTTSTTTSTTPVTTPTSTSTSQAASTTITVVASSSSVAANKIAAPAASTASSQASTASPTDFASTVLYHHNAHRLNHSAGQLTYNDVYAGYAKTTAEKCVFAHDLTPGGGGYGQNIAMWGSSGNAEALGATTAMAQAATDMWYDGEVTLFPSADYGKSSPDMTDFESWGHFSAMVWKNTQQVGCYSNYCAPGTMNPSMGAWFTVCNYYPAGNVGGEYGSNVLPPIGEASISA